MNEHAVKTDRYWIATLDYCMEPKRKKQQRNKLKTDQHKKQELSYRKKIARQLRIQFVEGISVTLKSMLRVTQCHWKRNHWTDHIRLTVRRVIGC